MKLRMLAALVPFAFFVPLSPAWAQKADPADLDGFWYSCAGTKDYFDIEPKDHHFLASQGGTFSSGKYHAKGNEITFAGRTLIMTDGELDEGSTHWVNGISLLKTNCPGAASRSQAALTGNGAATSQQQVQPAASAQPAQTTQPEQTAQAQQAPPLTETVPATTPSGLETVDKGPSSVDLASLQQSANAGDAAAQAELGSRSLNGKGAPQDYALGLAWSRKAATQGDARGQYLVGLCSENGWATNKDEKEGLQWWQKAADQGNAEAEFDLGSYWIAKGLKGSAADWVPYADIFSGIKEGKEIARGQKLIQAAAEQGHMAAEIHVGHAALRHHHYEEAVSWFKRASDQGDPAADISLGDLYYNGGKHFPKDPTQSADWYRKAVEKNSPAGEDKLGNLYRDGIGVAKDKTQALSWYDKAASKYQQMGDTALQGTRAEEETKTGKYFYGKAAEVMKKEAELGDSKADRALGKMYQQGLGVQQDKQQAANWYAKAVVDGNTDANTDLAAVKQEIAKDQAAQAAQAQEQAKSNGSDRRSWIALAGLAGAGIANAGGASATTSLQAGLNAAAVASQVTSENGGQDAATVALTGMAQAANGQATNPIQQTANEQIAAIHAIGNANAAQQQAAAQQPAALQHIASSRSGSAGATAGSTSPALLSVNPPGPITVVFTHTRNSSQGKAHVVSTPAGISCPPACSANFAEGLDVLLQVNADSDSVLKAVECVAWGGDTAPTTPGNSMSCVWPGIFAKRGGPATVIVDVVGSNQQTVITSNGLPPSASGSNPGNNANGSRGSGGHGGSGSNGGSNSNGGATGGGQGSGSGTNGAPNGGSCTDATKFVTARVKVAADGFVVGWLTNNSNQTLYVSYTFARGGKPFKPETGATSIRPGQTVGGEGGGIWASGSDVDTSPPQIFWYAVLQSDSNQGKNCGNAW